MTIKLEGEKKATFKKCMSFHISCPSSTFRKSCMNLFIKSNEEKKNCNNNNNKIPQRRRKE